MRILITGVNDVLKDALLSELDEDHDLTWLDTSALLDEDAVWSAVRGAQAVVHCGRAESVPGSDEDALRLRFDLSTRGAFVLFSAAVEAGVTRLVLGSTLEIFDGSPEDVYITEHWRPAPTDDLSQIGPYLSERVAQEFARDHAVSVTVLRLGRLVDEREAGGREPDPSWVDPRDAAVAFRLALGRNTARELNWVRRYAIYHIVAKHGNPRFLIDGARVVGRTSLGFAPVHNYAGGNA